MAASYKDLEFALENISLENLESIQQVDQIFSEIVVDGSQDLEKSLELVENFLIQSLDLHKELKKSA